MHKVRHKFQQTVTLGTSTKLVGVEMTYDLITSWRSQNSSTFTHGPRANYGTNMRFRVIQTDGLDLTTIMAMEHTQAYKDIQLECLKKMENLDGISEELAQDIRRSAATAAQFAHV